jgi:hypothetical protein
MVRRLFPRMSAWLSAVPDGRDPETCDYSGAALFWTGILMYAARLGARRQIAPWLRSEPVRRRLSLLAQEQIVAVPHGDTLDDHLDTVDPAALQKVSQQMARALIESRRLEEFRLLDKHYLLTVDMSGHLYLGDSPSRFTQGCLTQTTEDGRTFYYRPVCEAKLITRHGLALSVGSEFVENPPGFDPAGGLPQDSELPAAERLFERVKRAFPGFSFCVLLDARYCNEPTFARCRRHDWRFIITLKEGSLPSVWKEFQTLRHIAPQNRRIIVAPDGVRYDFTWVNDIAYEEHTLHVLECRWKEPDGTPHRFVWVTDIRINADNCDALAHEGGRQRWKIENNGFRAQKEEGFEMEHAYAKRTVAAKNFYLLLQVAHMLCQLFECYWRGKEAVKKAFGSLQNLGHFLLESLRRDPILDPEALRQFLDEPIQIRMNSP